MSMIEIPDDYKPIAVRDDRQGRCVISYSIARKQFYLTVNKVAAGPFNAKDLQQLMENIKDVLSMKGHFHYITDYTASGDKTI